VGETLKNKITAVESLRTVLATHFAEAPTFAELEDEMKLRLSAPKSPGESLPQDTLIRRAAWQYFEEEFGGWIRSIVRDELKRMADGKL
jgi:hypothetical protein